MRRIDPAFWKGRRVFVTGHMGFKGAWLCALLSRLGAISIGFGKDNREPLLYRELKPHNHIHNLGDINDGSALESALVESGAEVLIHLAAWPLVLSSYGDPVGTFDTNILGTAKVLQAARKGPALKSIIVITTDKVYENHEWPWAYREQDALGAADPYSASKAAAEIVTQSMSKSYFPNGGSPGVATARAGNVIGGGDWAEHRLLPDAARALDRDEPLICRNPDSVRPWQHVLDPLAGYLLLAETMATAQHDLPIAWNFGPAPMDALKVREVADLFVQNWSGERKWITSKTPPAEKEAEILTIDSALARAKLGWQPRWNGREAVVRTVDWYRAYSNGGDAQELVDRDILDYIS
ncbi:MAG: CDP-glucose 4,6-dehydratase [Hyphomicrobiaceae bacterium]